MTAAVPLVERLAEARCVECTHPISMHATTGGEHFGCVDSGSDCSCPLSWAEALLPVVEQAAAKARGEALREAADAIEPPGSDYYSPTAAWWLRERAEDIATTEGAP